MKENTLSLLPLYLVVFSAFFDTHAQMPVLAPYAISLGATPFLIGLVIGAYSFFNIAGNFAGGLTIDRRSWKVPLFLGLLGVSLILLLYTQAVNAYQLILIRASHGFMGGFLIPSALACLTIDQTGETNHSRRLSLFGVSIGLAAVSGPLFAGFIAGRFDYSTVYYSLAVIMFAATFTAFTLVRRKSSAPLNCNYPVISFRRIAAVTEIKAAFIFAFGTMGSTGTLASFLPSVAKDAGLNPAQTGMLFANFAMAAIVTQLIWPKIFKPLLKKDCRGCTLGLIIMALALVMAILFNTPTALFCAMALFGLGFGISFQGMLGLVIKGSLPPWRGRAIGLFFAVYSLGVALVPPLGGLIWQYILPLFPFYTAAMISLFCSLAGYQVCREKKERLKKPLLRYLPFSQHALKGHSKYDRY